MAAATDGLVYRHELPGDLSAPWRARDFLIDLELPKGAFLERCMLLTTELVADAVEHAAHDSLDLRVRLGADRVRIEISSRAPVTGPLPREGDGEPHDSFRLSIVEHLADAWGIDPTGYPAMWFELRFPVADPSPGVW